MQFSEYWMIFKEKQKNCKPFYAVFQEINFGEIDFFYFSELKTSRKKKNLFFRPKLKNRDGFLKC